MRFEYEAKQGADKMIRGEIDAESERAAAEQLTAKGLFVVSIRELRTKETKLPFRRGSLRKVGVKDVALFTNQMADLLASGLTLVKALEIILTQTENVSFRRIVNGIRQKIKEGKKFSESLSEYPKLFDPFFINMVRAGEAGGTLTEVFTHLAGVLEKEIDLRRKVMQALAYPIFIACFGGVTIFAILTLLIPKLGSIFEDFGESLPLLTRIVMGISQFFVHFWWLILGLIAAAVFWIRALMRQAAFNQAVSDLLWRIPLLGDMAKKADLARLARSLGMLLKNGVTILDALSVSQNIVRNATLGSEIRRVHDEVAHGSAFHRSMSRGRLFPALFVNLTAIGEETGMLDRSLTRLAEVYDREVDSLSKTITTLLEPTMIVLVGLVVFVLILSVLFPIFQINILVR